MGDRGRGSGGPPRGRGADNRGSRGGGPGRGGRGDYGGSRGSFGGSMASFQSAKAPAPIHQGPIPGVVIPPPAQIQRRGISTNIDRLPYRPNYGEKGRKILYFSNFFRMKYPNHTVYQYDFSIDPNVPKLIKRKVFEAWTKEYVEQVEAKLKVAIKHLIFDGEKNFYSMQVLPFQKQEFIVEAIADVDDQRPRKYTLQMQATTRVDLQNLGAYLNHDGAGPQPEMPRTAIQVLEILIRHLPAMLFNTVGRNSYYLKDNPGQSIRDGLMVHLGWFQSIRPACRQLVLNLDVSATAFYEVASIDTVIAHFFGAQTISPLWRQLRPNQIILVSRFLRHVMAELNYQPPGKRRKYRITGLDSMPAGQRVIPYAPDETDHPPNETVAGYYMRVHNIKLQYPDVPCVTSGTTRTIYLPMELVTVRAGQRHLGQLKPEQLAEMIKVTSTTPDDRLRRIVDGDVALHREPSIASFLQAWDLQIENRMMQITGRVLNTPNVTIGRGTVQPRDGSWSASSFAVPPNEPLQRWAFCLIDGGQMRDNDRRAIENFRRVLVDILVKKGMRVTNMQPPIVDNGTHHKNNLREMLLETGKIAIGGVPGTSPQIVLCILSKKNSALYPDVKRVADTEIGLMTQCIALPNLTKDRGIEMYADNVSLKVNAKLGGINSFLDPARELTGFAGNIPTMLIGADVTHPRPGSTGRSIAALVGSMDRRFCHYHAAIRSQSARVEIIGEIKNAIVQLFNAFRAKSNIFPQRVIFFRDGVSEGQYNEVVMREVRDFKQACEEVGAGKVSLTFIVVTKRHHARFVPVNREDGDRKNGNAIPGTTIDHSVTHAFAFDYYQFGSQGLLGTSRPAHYTILYDEHNFDADTIQEFTFRLCHLYSRCNKSVSLVPPVSYAHLLAARARYYAPEPSQSTPGPNQQQAPLPPVKTSIADRMYFM